MFELDSVLNLDAMPMANACPDEYALIAGGTTRYRFVRDVRDWRYAEAACRSETSGGTTHLVVFDDVLEVDAVRNAFPPDPPDEAWRAYVGYSRDPAGSPDVFVGVTGGELRAGSPLWESGEPNNGGSTGDVESVTHIGRYQRIADSPLAGRALFFVCECDGMPTEPPSF